MSEYQFLDFRAVDCPVSDKDLKFMRAQSTRADVDQWRFSNEYHYGNFKGNPSEMLRRGYDAHLHYANYGIRRIMFRLPQGLPCDKRTFRAYEVENCLTWEKDKRGSGGILSIEPEADGGTFGYEIGDLESSLERLLPLRAALITGDLRPLFVAWLACCYDAAAEVPPVPAGLSKLTRPLQALAKFYELPENVIKAAAKGSAPAPRAVDYAKLIEPWAADQSKVELQKLVAELLAEDGSAARSRIMAEIVRSQAAPAWPTKAPAMKTFGELSEATGYHRHGG